MQTGGGRTRGDLLERFVERLAFGAGKGRRRIGAVVRKRGDDVAMPRHEIGEGMRTGAQAFKRRQRGGELDHEVRGGLQLAVGEAGARIGGMQIGALLAAQFRQLGAEGRERVREAGRSRPRPRAAQHRAFERRDRARMGAFGCAEAQQADA